jgi:hypothetical protein
LRDRRVRTVSDVEGELGQPLLLALPVAKLPPAASSRTRARATKGRASIGHRSPRTT